MSDSQYGFREGWSTIDAILSLRTLTEEMMEERAVTLAISLDVANAFNSIPWGRIAEALRKKQIPSYIYRVLGNYFQDRYIVYENQLGIMDRFVVTRGVGISPGPAFVECGLRRGSEHCTTSWL